MTGIDTSAALQRVPSSAAAQMLGVCVKTLQRWRERGQIEGRRTRGGRWEWDVAAYLERESAGKGAGRG